MSEKGESRSGWSPNGWFVILGAILIFFGLVAYFYEENRDGSWIPSYQWLGILLMALGVASIIAEAALYFNKPKKQTPTTPPKT